MFNSIIYQLKQKETWIGILVVLLIITLSFIFTVYAMKFDFISRIQGLTMTCMDLTNKIILTVTFTLTAFGLSAAMLLGEFINYVDAKKKNNKKEMAKTLRNTVVAGFFTTASGIIVTFILFSRC